jgi:putative addiction module killer protein
MVKPRRIEVYRDASGRSPFIKWLDSLDRSVRARIDARLTRVEEGNLGDAKSVGSGVHELRMPFGPGYRVYFGEHGDTLVVLLCGGGKSNQPDDIARAKVLWRDWLSAED